MTQIVDQRLEILEIEEGFQKVNYAIDAALDWVDEPDNPDLPECVGLLKKAMESLHRLQALNHSIISDRDKYRKALVALGYHEPMPLCPHGMSHWIGDRCIYSMIELASHNDIASERG